MWPVSSRFRETVSGSHRAVSRVTLCTYPQFGPAPAGAVIPIEAGDVKLSTSGDIKGTLSLTVQGDYWAVLQPFGTELFCERGIDFGDGTTEYVPLGYFRINKITQQKAPYGPITVDAATREAQLIQNRVLYPFQVAEGTTHRQIFHRLVNGDPDLTGEPSKVGYGMFLHTYVPITWENAGYDPDATHVVGGPTIEDSGFKFLSELVDPLSCVLRFLPTGGLSVERRNGAVSATVLLAAAAQELLTHIAGGGGYYEDLTFDGQTLNMGLWNESLVTGFLKAYPGSDFTSGIGWGPNLITYLGVVVAGGAQPVKSLWAIRGGAYGTLVEASRSVTRDGVFNVVSAHGSDPAAVTGYRLSYNDDATSPLYWAGLFGLAPRYYSSSVLRTADEAQAAANDILARYTGLPSETSVFIVPNPAIQPGDVITSQLGVDITEHIVDEVTVPLAGDAPVELKTATINDVGNIVGETDGNAGQPPGDGTPSGPGDGGGDPGPGPDPGGGGGTPADPADGAQAAVLLGWGAVIDGDEFNYTGRPSGKWGLYDGAGHDGNGRRSPDAYSVHDGILTCHGENKTSGGAAFQRGMYGYRIEVRSRVYNTAGGGDRYHPVHILWPDSDQWPAGAEYDYFETDEGTGRFEAFLHLPNHEPYRQEHVEQALDIENWHNYACEWNPDAQTLKIWIDGQQVYNGSGRVAQAPGPMHPTFQLDDFGGDPRGCNFDMAWMRIYERPNA